MAEPATDPAATVSQLAAGVRRGERTTLARAITLVESGRDDEEARAGELLRVLGPATGGAHRIGVSGAPGVGKSTLIDALGLELVDAGRRVAVLAVDPSSPLSGGSILGDKSRMGRLAAHPRAFIRPSPTSLTLGGVARRTREAMLLCEAAGYDVVLVETVGVGQSEILVADMVDTFLVLVLAGGGDELQGIKKGILELADVVAVTKADGDLIAAARTTCAEYAAALRYVPAPTTGPRRAVAVSARTGAGLAELRGLLEAHRAGLAASGELATRRRRQLGRWTETLAEEYLLRGFRGDAAVQELRARIEPELEAGSLDPAAAARRLLAAFRNRPVE
jgi:LAO/AO transport system kinase